MSQRISLVGGIISFTAVLILSILSLDRVEGHGFFLMGLVTPEVEAPAVDVDSVDHPPSRKDSTS